MSTRFLYKRSDMKYFLGLDIGTSGVKAALIDEKGAIKGAITAAHPLLTPRPDGPSSDPTTGGNRRPAPSDSCSSRAR